MLKINKYIKKIKLFFIWQHEEEEQWLREMSLKGYELVSARLCTFTFRVCEPKDVVYKLDYRNLSRYEEDNYLTIFSEAGWEHVTGCMNWIYFRNENYSDRSLDIFNDPDSKAEMIRRIQKFIGLITVSELCMSVSVLKNDNRTPILIAFWIGIISLLTYGNIKLFFKYRVLKNRL